MNDFGKWTAIVLGVGLLLAGVGAYLHHAGYTEGQQDAIRSPADTVTVFYPKPVPVYVPTITLEHLTGTLHDVPTSGGENWVRATVDTLLGRVQLHVGYDSPLPLSPRGFFSISINQVIPDTVVISVPGVEIVRYVEVVKGPGWQSYGLCILGGAVAAITVSNVISHAK